MFNRDGDTPADIRREGWLVATALAPVGPSPWAEATVLGGVAAVVFTSVRIRTSVCRCQRGEQSGFRVWGRTPPATSARVRWCPVFFGSQGEPWTHSGQFLHMRRLMVYHMATNPVKPSGALPCQALGPEVLLSGGCLRID